MYQALKDIISVNIHSFKPLLDTLLSHSFEHMLKTLYISICNSMNGITDILFFVLPHYLPISKQSQQNKSYHFVCCTRTEMMVNPLWSSQNDFSLSILKEPWDWKRYVYKRKILHVDNCFLFNFLVFYSLVFTAVSH